MLSRKGKLPFDYLLYQEYQEFTILSLGKFADTVLLTPKQWNS